MSTFRNYDMVMQKLNFLPVDIQYLPATSKTMPAVTFYDAQTRCHVIRTPRMEGLLMHEAGHILFQHNRYSELAYDTADRIFQEKLLKYFPGCAKNKKRRSVYVHYILNMAMDCEVNSKLFSREEQDILANQVMKTFKTKSGGVFPKDLDLEDGQSYLYYLQKMSLDVGFAKKLVKSADGDIEVECLTDRQIGSKLAGLAKNMEMTNSLPDGTQITTFKQGTPDDYNPFGLGSGKDPIPGFGKGSGARLNVTGKRYTSLETALNSIMPKKEKGRRSDPLYNYNRRKNGSSAVLISKYVPREAHLLPAVYILVDCSGSMNRGLLDSVVSSLKEVSFNKRSKIVFWDTELLNEVPYEKRMEMFDFPSGGGTDMARGIRHIGKTFRSDDNMVLISDFCDNLDAIEKALVETGIKAHHLMIACENYNKGVEAYKGFNLCTLS